MENVGKRGKEERSSVGYLRCVDLIEKEINEAESLESQR